MGRGVLSNCCDEMLTGLVKLARDPADQSVKGSCLISYWEQGEEVSLRERRKEDASVSLCLIGQEGLGTL